MEYNTSDRLSGETRENDDRVVFYIEDLTTRGGQTLSPNFQGSKETRGLYPPETYTHPSRTCSVYSQSGRPRRSRTTVDGDGHSGTRRASVHGGRSRTNSCNGATPLGDGRRASVYRKNRPRRASTVRRKESIQPGKPAAEIVTKVPIPAVQTLTEIEQDRNRRKIVMVVLAIFIFLLVASVLVVVITLTNSSFHRLPSDAGNDSETHRNSSLRRENEELLNSLNRDSFVPENATDSSP